MAKESLDRAIEYFSVLYGVRLSDSDKEEICKNTAGFFAALNECDLKHRNTEKGENNDH